MVFARPLSSRRRWWRRMNLDDSTRQKTDTISFRFFTKFAILVDDARKHASSSSEAAAEPEKSDKWVRIRDYIVWSLQLTSLLYFNLRRSPVCWPSPV